MSTSVPQQHPAVVLRSHYDNLRSILAIALVAIVALAAALVAVVVNDDPTPAATPAARAASVGSAGAAGTVTSPHREIALQHGTVRVRPAPAVRYDGGPEEGTRGPGH